MVVSIIIFALKIIFTIVNRRNDGIDAYTLYTYKKWNIYIFINVKINTIRSIKIPNKVNIYQNL